VESLFHLLSEKGLEVNKEVAFPVFIGENKLDVGFRLDLLVEGKVIVEVKSVELLKKVHHKQLLTYLKLTDLKLGILVNFNESDINNGIFRKVR